MSIGIRWSLLEQRRASRHGRRVHHARAHAYAPRLTPEQQEEVLARAEESV